MRIPALLPSVVVAATLAAPPLARPQAIALPLRGEGELTLPDKQYDLRYGSVLLQADSSVKILFLDAGSLRTAFVGEWRSPDARTIELAIRAVLGHRTARGSGRIRLGPEGVIDALEVRGQADGREFSAHFENAVSTASLPIADRHGTGPVPSAGQSANEWTWGGTLSVVDVSRRGEGLLQDSEHGDYRFDRARLWLGQNDEFQLVIILGDTKHVLAGTWSGDVRFGPVPLELREAFGRRVQGTGRAWIRDRSWDRDFSLERVELDGWNGDRRFGLYFDAEMRLGDDGPESSRRPPRPPLGIRQPDQPTQAPSTTATMSPE
jgi:hypothetical protein